MNSIPYWSRVLVLLTLAIVLMIRDRGKGGSKRRWEYTCLFLFGIAGSGYGAINDLITVHISPDYFILGKGLRAGESLTTNAIQLGSQAGFSAAAIACAVWLFALRHTPVPYLCRLIAGKAWLPFVSAATCSVVFPLFFHGADPLLFSRQLEGIISHHEIISFITVWWVHVGAYLGLCAGVAGAIILTRQQVLTNS